MFLIYFVTGFQLHWPNSQFNYWRGMMTGQSNQLQIRQKIELNNFPISTDKTLLIWGCQCTISANKCQQMIGHFLKTVSFMTQFCSDRWEWNIQETSAYESENKNILLFAMSAIISFFFAEQRAPKGKSQFFLLMDANMIGWMTFLEFKYWGCHMFSFFDKWFFAEFLYCLMSWLWLNHFVNSQMEKCSLQLSIPKLIVVIGLSLHKQLDYHSSFRKTPVAWTMNDQRHCCVVLHCYLLPMSPDQSRRVVQLFPFMSTCSHFYHPVSWAHSD